MQKSYMISTVSNPVFIYMDRENACSNFLHFAEFIEEEVFELER